VPAGLGRAGQQTSLVLHSH